MVPTAGMSGNVVVVDRLTAIGASRPVALAALIMTIIAYYAAYGVVALVALVMLWLRGHVSWPIVALIGACLALSVAVPALCAVAARKRAPKAIPAWLRRFRPVCELFEMIREAPDRLVRDRTLEGKLTLLNGAVFALDGWTMQLCLFALGVNAPFGAAFAAFIMASIVVTLGPIPMGLGSFEAVSIGMLRALGVPFEAALSATLLFRGFTLWLPLIPGMFAARRRELKKEGLAVADDRVLDPVGIAAEDLVDRPGDDAGHVIAVERGDSGNQRVSPPMVGLEDRRDLFGALDLALPAIDGADRAKDVDAGGELLLDDGPPDALGLVGVGEHRIDREDAHARLRPSVLGSDLPRKVRCRGRARPTPSRRRAMRRSPGEGPQATARFPKARSGCRG